MSKKKFGYVLDLGGYSALYGTLDAALADAKRYIDEYYACDRITVSITRVVDDSTDEK